MSTIAEIRQKAERSGANSQSQPDRRPISWVLIICAITLGVYFRFFLIDGKVFWKDEVITQFAIAARDPELETGRLMGPDEVLRSVAPDPSTNVTDVVKKLASSSAEQAPLYYVLQRIWCDTLGEDPVKMRMFSALFGLLLIGGVYILGTELFDSSLAGGYAAALVALSPFHLAYAQDARPYSFWAFTMCLATIALWRAVKQPSFMRWLLFAIALTITEYTQVISLSFVAALCVWMLIQNLVQKRFDKGFWLSTTISVLCVLPWLSLIPTHGSKSHWLTAGQWGPTSFVIPVFPIVIDGFLDFNVMGINVPLTVVCWILLLAILSFMMLKAPKRGSTLALCLFFVPALVLIAYAIQLRVAVTLADRYLTPTMFAAPVCVGAGLAALAQFKNVGSRVIAFLLGACILAVGALSCLAYFHWIDWHYKSVSIIRLAQGLNSHQSPVVVLCDPPVPAAVVLCGLLRKDAKIMILPDKNSEVTLPGGYFRVDVEKTSVNGWKCQYVEPGSGAGSSFGLHL